MWAFSDIPNRILGSFIKCVDEFGRMWDTIARSLVWFKYDSGGHLHVYVKLLLLQAALCLYIITCDYVLLINSHAVWNYSGLKKCAHSNEQKLTVIKYQNISKTYHFHWKIPDKKWNLIQWFTVNVILHLFSTRYRIENIFNSDRVICEYIYYI